MALPASDLWYYIAGIAYSNHGDLNESVVMQAQEIEELRAIVAEIRQKLAQAQAEMPKEQPIPPTKNSEEQVIACNSRSSDILTNMHAWYWNRR